MIRVDVWLPDPAGALSPGAFGAGALIRIERADLALTPPYALGSYAEVHTAAIVAGTLQYQWWDAAGIATSSYRWRVSDSGNTLDSPYSAPFAGASPAASVLPKSYAGLSDVLSLFETPITSAAKVQRLAAALGEATDEIISFFDGRDFFRHPASGTDTWLASEIDADGRILHVHDGLIQLDKLEVSLDRGQTFIEITSADYALRASGPHQEMDPGGNQPAYHVELTGLTNFAWIGFPRWPKSIRITGARGWPAVPPALVEGCAERARQIVYGDPSFSGSVPGPEFSTGGSTFSRLPDVLYRFQDSERRRFTACAFANERWPGIAGRGWP